MEDERADDAHPLIGLPPLPPARGVEWQAAQLCAFASGPSPLPAGHTWLKIRAPAPSPDGRASSLLADQETTATATQAASAVKKTVVSAARMRQRSFAPVRPTRPPVRDRVH